MEFVKINSNTNTLDASVIIVSAVSQNLTEEPDISQIQQLKFKEIFPLRT